MPQASELLEMNPLSTEIDAVLFELNELLRQYNDYHRDAEGIAGLNVILGDNGFAVENRLASVSANTTLDGTYRVVLVDTSSGDITITLPAVADSTDREYIIKNIGDPGNNIIVDGNSAETIDGAETQTVFTVIHIICDGSSWHIL